MSDRGPLPPGRPPPPPGRPSPSPSPSPTPTSQSMPDGSLEITLRGESLQLLPDRALCWPARRTLIVADIHFGKDDVFRRAGLAFPQGAVAEDLARLSRLLASTASERLLVLGDFVHGAVGAGDAFPPRFAEWRSRHRELAIEVVAGNHDRQAERGTRDWASLLRWHVAGLFEPPFAFEHGDGAGAGAPRATEPDRGERPPGDPTGLRAAAYTISGHLHPVARLRVPGGRALRVPVFWRRAEVLVLPSFGSLTGGYEVRAAPGEQLLIAGPERVLPLPTAADSPS